MGVLGLGLKGPCKSMRTHVGETYFPYGLWEQDCGSIAMYHGLGSKAFEFGAYHWGRKPQCKLETISFA